jgi:alpha-galactosidase
MIIDGAWYAPNGEWFARTGDHEVFTAKYPDLRGLVDKIHAAGLSAILWCMPHMIGDESSSYRQLEHLLFRAAHPDPRPSDLRNPWTFLCPRTPGTQDHLAAVLDHLLRTYDLDGLKIDFIDNSGTLIDECTAPHQHAQATFGEGMDACLRRMRTAIDAVRPDASIEFRVNYANVNNRPYGNCFRAVDCPYDYDQNRRLCTLVKPVSRGVVVHSDPAYWHPNESVANIARYLSSMIFCGSVPTFSVDVRRLRSEEERLIGAWLGFYDTHKQDLLFGDFTPVSMDSHFSENRIMGERRAFLGFFLPEGNRACVEIPQRVDEVYIANGTNLPRLRCELRGAGGLSEATIYDPFLTQVNRLRTEESHDAVRLDVAVPCGGLVRLTQPAGGR